jgi:uncharacterized membrane protein
MAPLILAALMSDGGLSVQEDITRHPLLVGTALWAAAHLLANGAVAALLLFGTLLVTAVRGTISLDHKTRLKVGPGVWENFAAHTSRLPFAAILAGRTPLRPGELSGRRLAIGLFLFALALDLPQSVFGLPPL